MEKQKTQKRGRTLIKKREARRKMRYKVCRAKRHQIRKNDKKRLKIIKKHLIIKKKCSQNRRNTVCSRYL